MEVKKILHSPTETIDFAKRIGSRLAKGDVIAYHGGLGAGKTTFTRGLAMGLGLADEVTSQPLLLSMNIEVKLLFIILICIV